MRVHSAALLLALTFVLAACGDDAAAPVDSGAPGTDAGPPDTGIRRRDAGPPAMSFELTPEGCGYVVRTPEVTDGLLDGEAIGAAPEPDHIHASFAGPSHQSFAINWRTDLETTRTRILYGTDEAAVEAADDADETAGVRMQRGHTFSYVPLTGDPTRIHEVHVCGLTPSTTYHYKVGAPGHWSDVHAITTGPVPGPDAMYSFAVLGDSRGAPEVFAELQGRIAAHAPDFQIYTGDAVEFGAVQAQWDEFFEASSGTFTVQDALAGTAFMTTNGNHEALALNYLAQFALPQDVTEHERGEGEQWYSFDYGNAHIAVLDAAVSGGFVTAQAEWLDADLAAVDRSVTPWVFVMHHHAVYSCSNHGSILPLREAWQPVYDEHQVDVVFMGHDHNYERSKPIRGFQAAMPAEGQVVAAGPDGEPMMGNGTVYVVAGGAGAPLYGSEVCDHTHLSESVQHYLLVEVDGRSIRLVAHRLDGTLLDDVTWTK